MMMEEVADSEERTHDKSLRGMTIIIINCNCIYQTLNF